MLHHCMGDAPVQAAHARGAIVGLLCFLLDSSTIPTGRLTSSYLFLKLVSHVCHIYTPRWLQRYTSDARLHAITNPRLCTKLLSAL